MGSPGETLSRRCVVLLKTALKPDVWPGEWQGVEPVQFECQEVEPIQFEWQEVEPIQFEWHEGDYIQKKIVYMLSLYDKRWSRKILIDKKLKKDQGRVTGFKPKTFVENRVKHIQFDYHDGENMNLFLCCRYWSAGWMAGQNLSYCGTYYDMFFESLSICLLGSFTWFSKNFYIYIRFQFWSSFNLLGSNAGRQLC